MKSLKTYQHFIHSHNIENIFPNIQTEQICIVYRERQLRLKGSVTSISQLERTVRDLSINYRVYTIRALASARGSVARRANRHRIWPLEGPKGPRVAETCESEGPKGPRTSKAKCPFLRLPVLLCVFHNSA